jgi:glycerol-3-phosphate dehydrogenase subunit C
MQLHNACHARAQNIGCKSAEMLRNVPGLTVNVVEKCSGHGGSWGCKSKTHQTALKVAPENPESLRSRQSAG